MSRVILAESWPRAICTCLIEQPEPISTEAKKCRRSWYVIESARPARLRARRK